MKNKYVNGNIKENYIKYYVLSNLLSGTANEVIDDCITFSSKLAMDWYLLKQSFRIVFRKSNEKIPYSYIIYYCFICGQYTFFKPVH